MMRTEFLKKLCVALNNIDAEILDLSKQGRIAAGLSSEGYVGGYKQALLDVEAAFTHGYPSDPRGYWRERT